GVFSRTTLLNDEQQLKLNEFYGKNDQHWQLIYKASRDGFSAADFHRHSDKQGPTMTVIRSTGCYLFGGYASTSWTSSEGCRDAKNSFLFLLTNANGSPPTKFVCNNKGIGIFNHWAYGPIFGDNDLWIHGDSNANIASYCDL
ncbi:unnamed protein product, partial [Didymodactylos carnosus]